VGELGRRFFQKNDAGMPVIRTAQDVFDYVNDMRDLPKEHLRGLYLNTHFKVIHDELISIGTVDANMIHPREVFKPAIDHMAAAVVLVHNHPSGVVDPSSADREVTEQLIAAGRLIGIELIDHVIVTKDMFTSIPAHYTLPL
jgi:DNA repair protein RadC